MLIYLADLIYDTIITNAVLPLNIGYVAAAVDGRFSDQVEIKLFKYPAVLEQAIRKAPPDILGLSHYSWNARLNQAMIQFCKQISPGTGKHSVTPYRWRRFVRDTLGIIVYNRLNERPSCHSQCRTANGSTSLWSNC